MGTEDSTPRHPYQGEQETVILRDLAPASMLLKDRYLLVRQLGEGGFGSVYLAQDRAMHERSVVVKIQLNQSMDDPWFERKFSEEVRALSLIDHPGVVSAIDSGRTPDGKPFLVMQYVDGVTLRAVMAPEGMPLARAAEILKQMGHALAAAHEKGIWHRDLKPENLMLQRMTGGGERVRLIDFGIATVADLVTNLTTTRVAGSVMYMAPEQRMGQPSASADIYAMGLIAYEVLTGRKPFHSENAGQLTAMQRAGVRLKPSDLRPALTPRTEQLILQSLEYEPRKRPASAREFGDQLYQSLVASDVTRLTGPVKATRGSRHWLWVACIGMTAAAIGGAYYQLHLSSPKPADVKAPVSVPPRAAAPAVTPSQDGAIELAFWNSVKDSNEPQLYREYLTKYPNGQFESLARAKLSILAKTESAKAIEPPVPEEEKELWNSARDRGQVEAYQAYLNRYPRGKHASAARKKLSSLIKDESKAGLGRRVGDVMPELSYWNSIEDRNDSQAYREYLAKYPKGMFAPLARMRLEGPPKVPKLPDTP